MSLMNPNTFCQWNFFLCSLSKSRREEDTNKPPPISLSLSSALSLPFWCFTDSSNSIDDGYEEDKGRLLVSSSHSTSRALERLSKRTEEETISLIGGGQPVFWFEPPLCLCVFSKGKKIRRKPVRRMNGSLQAGGTVYDYAADIRRLLLVR